MLRVCLSGALFSLLAASVLSAQSKADAGLRVVVVEGEGAINNIRDHTARAPVIRVLDDRERPVTGATVNFLLPELGSSGSFSEGRTHLTVTTGEDGRAVARGLRPNNVAGRFQIRVSASWQGRTGSALVNQVNVAPAPRGKSKSKFIIAALVAGGAVGAVFAAKGSSSSSSPGSSSPGGTTITPGSPVFGPPK
jgi:hypothetical protein